MNLWVFVVSRNENRGRGPQRLLNRSAIWIIAEEFACRIGRSIDAPGICSEITDAALAKGEPRWGVPKKTIPAALRKMQFHPLPAEEARIIAYTVFIRRIRETGIIRHTFFTRIPPKLCATKTMGFPMVGLL